jgi:hypothetical protein
MRFADANAIETLCPRSPLAAIANRDECHGDRERAKSGCDEKLGRASCSYKLAY